MRPIVLIAASHGVTKRVLPLTLNSNGVALLSVRFALQATFISGLRCDRSLWRKQVAGRRSLYTKHRPYDALCSDVDAIVES